MARKSPKVQTLDRDDPVVPPKPFVALDQVLGQDRALSQLKAAIAAGRIHHAWIFHGPVGVGKFTTALAFAAMLLDATTGPDLSGNISVDPDSPTQRLVRAGTHPDLHIVTKELAAVSSEPEIRDRKQTNIPKAVLREFLLEPAAKTRVVVTDSPAAKVFIVDEAELIDHVGQNSLLKMLEEPPPGSVIILVTSSDERLLPTIRSRAQRIGFGVLDDRSMQTCLKRHAPDLDADQLAWLTRFAAGSPGVAASAIDNDLFGWHTTLTPMLARLDQGSFPIEMGATLAALIDDRAAAWVKRNSDASKDAANKAWARRMLAFLAEHYRAQLATGEPRAALRAIEILSLAEEELHANVNLGLLTENMVAQLANRR